MNRLAVESSPYLRQHADNPVHWWAWGPDVFEEAGNRDVPVLLSVGYSACHWCHVMAHESFEDEATAAVMNERFVNVKVDREERPDVDAIYMQAVQALTGRGGWPMTVFLDPDGRPFYGGTYYPPEPRHGMPGFVQVLEAISDAWTNRRDELDEQAGRIHDAIERSTSLETYALDPVSGPVDDALERASVGQDALVSAYEGIRQVFDPEYGGFGRAPKFPQAMTVDFLLHAAVRNGSDETLAMATTSLDRMAAGGLYDQIGGGFHRYSVDRVWLVPHFEKMLYDQALLVGAYLRGFLVTGEERYRRIVEETVAYVLRDLRHPDGGFFSAEDADSEGVEGRFYVWDRDELRAVCDTVGTGVADEVERWFGVSDAGNFEGSNILFVVDPTAPRPDAVARAVPALYDARALRVRPGLDDKVLTGWNALFAHALAAAGAALGRADWIDAARTNIDFLLTALRDDTGRLLRSWQDGRAAIAAYAEDYAALLEAVITLAETDDVARLDEARALADAMIELFADDTEDGAGFFTTGTDAQQLIVRPRSVEDNAVPSENSLAANALLRLAALTGDDRYRAYGDAWVSRIAPAAARYPTAFAYALGALERSVTPPLEIAVVGAPSEATAALLAEVDGRLLPASVRVRARAGYGDTFTPLLEGRGEVDGAATAYVCERFACRMPVSEPDELRAQIDAVLASRGVDR